MFCLLLDDKYTLVMYDRQTKFVYFLIISYTALFDIYLHVNQIKSIFLFIRLITNKQRKNIK